MSVLLILDRGCQYVSGEYIKLIEEVKTAVANAVDFYNNDRPNMSVDMMASAQAASWVGEINKWCIE